MEEPGRPSFRQQEQMTMSTSTTEVLSREETRALHRLASRLEREAQTCRLGDLEDRAEKLEAEAKQVRQKIEAATDARQERDLDRLREKKRQQKRHEESERKREEAAERRDAAFQWFKEYAWHGEPVETVEALRAASEAGHQAADVLAVTVRLRRRRDGADVLGWPGRYLRRDYIRADEV